MGKVILMLLVKNQNSLSTWVSLYDTISFHYKLLFCSSFSKGLPLSESCLSNSHR